LRTFTYIIAGGGCAGLSVALHLAKLGPASASILIIDQDIKTTNDRTWCFWHDDALSVSRSVISKSWSNLSFHSGTYSTQSSISPFTYSMVRSADWYEHMHRQLADFPQVSYQRARIEEIDEDLLGPFVLADSKIIRGRTILNSCKPAPVQPAQSPTYHLWQHFKGWWIETSEDTFDPDTARLMDFRTRQKGSSRFFYILPLTPRKALVEYTVFSKELLESGAYDKAFHEYMDREFPGMTYTVQEEETGKIPMTNRSFNRYTQANIINIGTVGGAVKPTTGYAFLRILAESKQVAQKLVRGERVTEVNTSASRFAFYDRLLLHILQAKGWLGESIFSALFRHNPIPRILVFLDERTSYSQEVLIFARLPKLPFLKALWQQLIHPIDQVKLFFEKSFWTPKNKLPSNQHIVADLSRK